jgi:hypothetical protein
MGIFSKQVSKQTSAPAVGVAAASNNASIYNSNLTSGNYGQQMVGNYYSYFDGPNRALAMQVPAINRARDLICSMIGSTQLQMYNETWNESTGNMEKKYIAPRSWLHQPDPSIPYSTFMSWITDDLVFFGRCFLLITSRTSDGFPASFTRLPAAMITTRDQAGPVFFAPSNQVFFQGGQIDELDLIQMISPVQGWLYSSQQSIDTSLRIENARQRNANSVLPAGWLKQTSGEPLSGQELADMAASFNQARWGGNGQTAALSEGLDYHETNSTPDKMMLIDSARFSVEEMARLTNCPPYLLGASIGNYSYVNSQSAREDLFIFAARQYANCIAETLSMNNVLPRGTCVEFDVDDWLEDMVGTDNEYTEEAPATSPPPAPAQSTQESLA